MVMNDHVSKMFLQKVICTNSPGEITVFILLYSLSDFILLLLFKLRKHHALYTSLHLLLLLNNTSLSCFLARNVIKDHFKRMPNILLHECVILYQASIFGCSYILCFQILQVQFCKHICKNR